MNEKRVLHAVSFPFLVSMDYSFKASITDNYNWFTIDVGQAELGYEDAQVTQVAEKPFLVWLQFELNVEILNTWLWSRSHGYSRPTVWIILISQVKNLVSQVKNAYHSPVMQNFSLKNVLFH